MKTTKISMVKKGDYFRFLGKKKVYIMEGGGPKRGWRYVCADDAFSEYATKTDRAVEIDFEY